MKKLLATTALLVGALTSAAFAALSTPGGASGTIQYSVAVCDPNSPFHCLAPASSGSLAVTATQGTTPWVSNITQFGSSNVVTGTGASGAGIPRVTISNDSSIANTSFLSPVNGVGTNPTSVLTRPADTTAYAAGDLIASSTTAASIVVPNFAIANAAGAAIVPRIRLATNATTGWGTTLTLTMWSAAPTYTNGDNGAYAVATGSASRLAQYSCVLSQYGDGASGECQISVNNFALIKLASGTAVYWDLQATAAATPISGQTFTATAEVLN